MSAILLANTNTAGSGLVKGNSRDSGNIVTVGTPGKPQMRQTFGAQNQATTAIQSGTNYNNNLPNTSGPGGSGTPVATITNTTITSSFVNGLPQVVVTCSAVNSFVVGQSVKFAGLTNGSAVNNLVGVIQAAGLSGTAFEAIITNFVPNGALPTAVSAADAGTASVNYFSREACLSVSAETK